MLGSIVAFKRFCLAKGLVYGFCMLLLEFYKVCWGFIGPS